MLPGIYLIELPAVFLYICGTSVRHPAVLSVVWAVLEEIYAEKSEKLLPNLLTKKRKWCIIYRNKKEAEQFPFSPAIQQSCVRLIE